MLLCVSPEIPKSLLLGKNSEVCFKKKKVPVGYNVCVHKKQMVLGRWHSLKIRNDYKQSNTECNILYKIIKSYTLKMHF